jgi:hypothetical protein
MARIRGQREAFGAPGCDPRWTEADKDGIGTAFSSGSRVWFTLRRAADFDPHIEFTLFWKDRNAWEGRNYKVAAY